MWPIKGHHKKCHTLTKNGKWHQHICPDILQLQGQKTKNKWRNVTTPSDPAICIHGTMEWLHVDIPTARQPWPCKTWGCVWEVLLSRSGMTGLTSSSTFDVHGNPAKAACHLLRTFVKVVKQPWQQTQRQQQQKGACDTPWICFIKCSLIWFKHQMNWLWSLPSEGWQEGFQNHSLHRWLHVSRGKSSQILPGKHPHILAGHCVYSQCLQLSPSGLPWVTRGLCKEDPAPHFSLSSAGEDRPRAGPRCALQVGWHMD